MENILKNLKRNLKTAVVGCSILYYPSLSSTMDVARELAQQGASEGTVVICDEQTGGRGRQGRKWLATAGSSILMSVIFRPAARDLAQINMLASLATVLTIKKIARLDAVIKWPNDVLITGKKVAGILIENIFDADQLRATIVGVGLNVTLDVSAHPEIRPIATSLSSEVGRPLNRDDLLQTLLEEMDILYQSMKRGEDIYSKWLPYVETMGKIVSIKSGNHLERGVAKSINPDGSITLLRDDGSTVTIATGE